MVAVSPIEASDSVACRRRTISVIQRSPSRSNTSAKMLAEVDEEDFPHARDAAVIRDLGLPVVHRGSRRQDFDDQQRVGDKLISPLRLAAGHRNVGRYNLL